jgi:hypothetical protein
MELAQLRDVYLGPNSDAPQTLDAVLDQIWEEIFEEELFAWSTDEQEWPARRTRQMFDAWFAAELCDSVIDLVPDEPLTEEDVDLEALQIALNTCAFCGADVPVDSGRMAAFKLSDRSLFQHVEGRALGLSVGPQRIITVVVTSEDSTPAQEGADVIGRACSRRCEKQIEKLVPRALHELQERLAEELSRTDARSG